MFLGKKDLSGKWFGKLQAVCRVPAPVNCRGDYWQCECACGESKTIREHDLIHGKSMSCGCARHNASTTHGMSGTVEYATWQAMRGKCYNENNKSYHTHGVKGIRVCEAWKDDPTNFLDDMGIRPHGEYTFIRIDKTKDFSPDNCKWQKKSVSIKKVDEFLARWKSGKS